MRVCWPRGQTTTWGNAVGYTRANWGLRRGIELAGGVIDDEAEIAVHFMYPRAFTPISGKTNILYTMYEMPEIPPAFALKLPLADAIFTPCAYSAELFRPLVAGIPVHVVPLGYDEEVFPFVRRAPRRRKRWLFVGAPNVRKGIHRAQEAWDLGGWHARTDCELYLKTTTLDGTPGGIRRLGNIVVDERSLPDIELVGLYASADFFLFPTTCEGWGLPLLEAMGTGLPCVTALHTGLVEFADPTCVCAVDWKPAQYRCAEDLGSGKPGETSWLGTVCEPILDDLICKMRGLERDWLRAQRLGRRAHARARQFTWRHAGDVLLRACAAVIREAA